MINIYKITLCLILSIALGCAKTTPIDKISLNSQNNYLAKDINEVWQGAFSVGSPIKISDDYTIDNDLIKGIFIIEGKNFNLYLPDLNSVSDTAFYMFYYDDVFSYEEPLTFFNLNIVACGGQTIGTYRDNPLFLQVAVMFILFKIDNTNWGMIVS